MGPLAGRDAQAIRCQMDRTASQIAELQTELAGGRSGGVRSRSALKRSDQLRDQHQGPTHVNRVETCNALDNSLTGRDQGCMSPVVEVAENEEARLRSHILGQEQEMQELKAELKRRNNTAKAAQEKARLMDMDPTRGVEASEGESLQQGATEQVWASFAMPEMFSRRPEHLQAQPAPAFTTTAARAPSLIWGSASTEIWGGSRPTRYGASPVTRICQEVAATQSSASQRSSWSLPYASPHSPPLSSRPLTPLYPSPSTSRDVSPPSTSRDVSPTSYRSTLSAVSSPCYVPAHYQHEPPRLCSRYVR